MYCKKKWFHGLGGSHQDWAKNRSFWGWRIINVMRFELRIWAADNQNHLALTPSEYQDLLSSLRRIYLATDTEEKLDLLLENYYEYERDLLDLGLRYSLFMESNATQVYGEVHVLNRRILNLLSTARTYRDQVTHTVSKFFGPNQPEKEKVARLFSAEYDQHLEYRVAEALRNYSQHRSLPIYSLTRGLRREEIGAPEQHLRSWIAPNISVDALTDEGGFKTAVLEQLQATGESNWPITPILRKYVESLASVHVKIRQLLTEQVEKDRRELHKIRQRAEAELEGELRGLFLTSVDDDGNVMERHSLSVRPLKRMQVLLKKNGVLKNLSRRYVSSQHP